MQNKWLMCILSALCVFLGFAISFNLFGVKNKTYTVRAGDVFYEKPSVTVAQAKGFAVSETLKVTDSVELAKPTAVQAKKDILIDDKDKTKYQLRKGATYKVTDAQLSQANAPCVLDVETTKGNTAKIEVEKSALQPVDEGTWLRVRARDGSAQAWVRVKSRWY